jgi:UDP-N-acetylmuramate dehydrogenase
MALINTTAMLSELQARVSPLIRTDVPLAPYTTYKIGGPADYLLEADSGELAARALATADELGLPVYVLGGGSNVLVSDEGFRGLVVVLANREVAIDGARVTCGAGAPTGLVAQRTVAAGLTGFEWAVGLPGTIGGAVRGNAGMWGGEMKDSVAGVTAWRAGERHGLTGADCAFAYRDSRFKREGGWLIVEVELRLTPAEDSSASKALLMKHLSAKREKQPIEFNSAGCVFQNWRPPAGVDDAELRRLLDVEGDVPVPHTASGEIPAGWLIDHAGLKGLAVGHASVSTKHANFLVSDGKAKADDVLALVAAVKMKVRNATGGIVQLTEEIELVGF